MQSRVGRGRGLPAVKPSAETQNPSAAAMRRLCFTSTTPAMVRRMVRGFMKWSGGEWPAGQRVIESFTGFVGTASSAGDTPARTRTVARTLGT